MAAPQSRTFERLAVESAEDLLFGKAPRPLKTRSGMRIGGGTVYPELNFTLPDISVEASNMPEIERHYRQIIAAATKRAVELEVPGLVVEFETLPPMTEHPDLGMAVVRILLDGLKDAEDDGLKSVLRVTPNDNRDFIRPPQMRSGRYWEAMLELFDRSAAEGAELLSIESVGGKEIHDEALTMADVGGVLFALCVLGVRDMRFLWSALQEIADKHGVHCAGDTACGFGNTAMVLAEQKMIPRVFAALVRPITAVRSLVAYECGAVGPGKDCGYENIYLKAITGLPMSNEGKAATCAHLSPVGNVAAAAADCWSNESVQHVKLLGGMAPICFLETLAYDCRLMNEALADGDDAARQLQRWMVRGDARLDPQAYVLRPDSAIRLAGKLVESLSETGSHYAAGRAVAAETIALLRAGVDAGELKLSDRETPWLDQLDGMIHNLPADESQFIEQQLALVDRDRFNPAEYGL